MLVVGFAVLDVVVVEKALDDVVGGAVVLVILVDN